MTITTRKPLAENGAALHRWLGLGATPPTAPMVDEPILVDLSESLLASQSALGPYWGRGVRRKRDRPEPVDLCQEEDSSEKEPELGRQAPTPAPQVDHGYDSCDSEDLDSGFVRYREQNLADWLGLRPPWPGWKLEAISTMRAYQVDFFSWVSGRRRWADERRGPGRTKEDRRREQLERETQGRLVQPVVLAEELSERRRRGHATGPVNDMAAASESGVDGLLQDSPKRRRTELLLGGARDRPVQGEVASERITGTASRGKRKRAHKPAVDAKRRREAAVAAAAFDGTDSDEDGPAPAGPAPFSAPEVEKPDNPMDVG